METALNWLKVALGVGLVIFIHELGHFLVAKWNGVKVTKFSIGFGPTLVSFRRGVGLRIGVGSRPAGPDDPPSYGETEYVLAALPLGGFVLMAGGGHEDSGDEAAPVDPRDMRKKSVGARMAIITAGVIMNVVLGWACFTLVYTQGWVDIAARVGGVLPGSPAYLAGLRAGDEIVAIDGHRDLSFNQVTAKIRSSVANQVIKFTVKRPGVEGERTLELQALREAGASHPTVGFYPSSSLELFPDEHYAPLPGQDLDKARVSSGFAKGDKIVAIGPVGGDREPVVDHFDFVRKSQKLRKEVLAIEVERTEAEAKPGQKPTTSRVTVNVSPQRFVDFGMRMTPGLVVATRPDSPSRKAGFERGDRIVAVDGRKDFDPMKLPDEALAAAGKPMVFTVERPEEGKGKPPRTIELTATPDDSPIWSSANMASLDIPGLGLALEVLPKVADVKPESPASRAKLKPGDVIHSMVLTPDPKDKSSSKPNAKPVTITFDPTVKSPSWPSAFASVQDYPWISVELLLNDSKTPVVIKPEVDLDRYHPTRGLNFLTQTRTFPPLSVAEAAPRGAEETWDNITGIYSIFQNLAQRRVGGNAFGGLPTILGTAYDHASSGIVPFFHFIGMLSINLAVLNFLPIPPLDGGQFLFLLAEKIKGKPLPESWLNVVTLAGIIFVVLLMLAVNIKDVVQIFLSYF